MKPKKLKAVRYAAEAHIQKKKKKRNRNEHLLEINRNTLMARNMLVRFKDEALMWRMLGQI
jgi:hypothetical protein